jgi:hypothetical protein
MMMMPVLLLAVSVSWITVSGMVLVPMFMAVPVLAMVLAVSGLRFAQPWARALATLLPLPLLIL